MKYLKMKYAYDRSTLEEPYADNERARYVRADLLDELLVTTVDDENSGEHYEVTGIRYADEDCDYTLETFATVEEAKKYLDELVKRLE